MFGFGKSKKTEKSDKERREEFHNWFNTSVDERMKMIQEEKEAKRKKSRTERKMDKKTEEYFKIRERRTQLMCEDVELNMTPVDKGPALPLPYFPSNPEEFFPKIKLTNEKRYAMLQADMLGFELINKQLKKNQSFIQSCEDFQDYAPYINLKSNNSALNKFVVNISDFAKIPPVINGLKEYIEYATKYVEKELAIIGSGIHGENRVNEELDMHNYLWTNLKNIRFEVDGESVESDNVIVCSKGIFTVEVKNYAPKGNYSLAITRDGQWQKVYPNGKHEVMNSVTAQVSRHIAYKQKAINTAWQSKYPASKKPIMVEPIFVLANDKVQVQNDANLPIMRASQIYYYLKDKPDVLTDAEVNALVAIIKEKNLPPKTYEVMATSKKLVDSYMEINKEMARLVGFFGYVELITTYSKIICDEMQREFSFKFQEVDILVQHHNLGLTL